MPAYLAKSITALVALLSLASTIKAQLNSTTYKLKTDLSYENFFSNFDFYSGPDPTNGFVQYQNLESAAKNEYIGYLNDTKSIFLGVDYKNKDPKGRASVRVESNLTVNHGVLVAYISHMPASECGTWPAFWLLGEKQWPTGGEIDILEGVNDYQVNAMTLHTSEGCTIENSTMAGEGSISNPPETGFSGTLTTSNCDVNAAGQGKNVGCSIKLPPPSALSFEAGSTEANSSTPVSSFPATYGTPFNKAGGGIYAVEILPTGISTWFFPADNSTTTPSHEDVMVNPDPTKWGQPIAKFEGSGCDFHARFQDLRIIFNTAFCGDWAGREWESGGCAKKTGVSTCAEYVREHPEKFAEAYWEIGGLWWFEK